MILGTGASHTLRGHTSSRRPVRAMHLAYRSTFRRDADIELALEAATFGGARLLGIDAYGIAAGATADLLIVDVASPAEAVVSHPSARTVINKGRPVGR